MTSDYLTGQKQWGKIPIQDCIKNILNHIQSVFKGEGIFYTRWCTVSMIAAVVLVLLLLFQRRQTKEKILPFLAVCFLQTTPFLLTVYGATTPAIRSLFIYPFTFACNMLLLFVIFPDVILAFEKTLPKNWSKSILVFVCLGSTFILIEQYYEASQQQYTDAYVQKKDENLAYNIEQSIIEKTSDTGEITKPVVFIGFYDCPKNNTFMGGEAVGASIFNINIYLNPRFFVSSLFSTQYMQSLGIPITNGSEEQAIAARLEAQTMTIYPSEGSIRDMGDYVIVKLGDDPWYEEDGLPPVT